MGSEMRKILEFCSKPTAASRVRRLVKPRSPAMVIYRYPRGVALVDKGGGVFGYNSDWWNVALIVGLIATALAAVAVCFTTYGVVYTQKIEAAEKDRVLERYKLDADKKIADAKLETERLRAQVAWRRISPEQHSKLIKALSGNSFAMYFEFSQSDPEATQFAEDIYKCIVSIPGITVYPPHPLVLPPAPRGLTVSGTDGVDKTALESALTSAELEFTVSGASEGAVRLSVGSKPSPF